MLGKNRRWPYSLGLFLFLGLVANPAFAEVASLQTNNESFYKGDEIEFSGTVEDGSTGLVTIVIRDLNDEFVLLTQAIIDDDNSFERKIKIENKFTENGNYNAIGFILSMTKGATTNFDVSLNEIPITEDYEIDEIINQKIINNNPITVEPPIKPAEPLEIVSNTYNVDFVDPHKDPYHYVERYYSEPSYKSWFDRNYPGQTIEKFVGYTDDTYSIVPEIIDNEIIPEAQASSIAQPTQNTTNNSDIAQISLSIAALGILFGAVYGVKRQVDSNSKQISLNKYTIRKKILNPILGLNPKEILQTRLAKGEITLEEYDKLKTKLN
ncbi:MAG: SHOCT domain-containing protein [Nitrosopumilus sp.]|nr:SHOCT domain-containing protein [Nitrosopumilus sp.]